jgi:hypothetical protein
MRQQRHRVAAALTGATVTSALLLSGCSSSQPSRPVAEATQTPAQTATQTPTPTVTAARTPRPGPTSEFAPQPGYDRTNFSNSTRIDNKWFPMQPGTQYIYEGFTENDEGQRIPHRLIITVTNATKVIDGVRNVVLWDRDYQDGELVEAEIAFFAQADDGDIWHFGEYPEEYEGGEFVAAPTWIHGLKGAQAGITVRADPKPGDPSHAQGWGPEVGWTDRARVHKVGQRTCVPAGCYENVLVIAEYSKEEPDAAQYKYYAPGVGLVRVGFSGADPTRETLQLVKIIKCTPAQRARARAQALKLEKHAYQVSKAVYAKTAPMR